MFFLVWTLLCPLYNIINWNSKIGMHRALFDCIDHGIFFVGEVLAAIDLKKVEIRQRYDRIIPINYSYKIAVANSLVL